MIITILALVLRVLSLGNSQDVEHSVIVVPHGIMGQIPEPITNEDNEWAEFWLIARREYMDEFTALFNSYEVKFNKNGRTMIRQGDSGSFKFARKSA